MTPRTLVGEAELLHGQKNNSHVTTTHRAELRGFQGEAKSGKVLETPAPVLKSKAGTPPQPA